MKERSDLQLLDDALHFANRAHDLTGGMSLSMLKQLDHYEHATRSYLILLGAAFGFIEPDLKRRHPQIPWNAIRGLRNRLVHAYWRVDHEIVQRIVRDDLPVLAADLKAVLAAERGP